MTSGLPDISPAGLSDDDAVEDLLDLTAAVDLADRMRDQALGGDTVADRGAAFALAEAAPAGGTPAPSRPA